MKCITCDGNGTTITKRGRCPCGCDDSEGECESCEGTGLGGCVWCGERTPDMDARYCSEECRAADHAGPAMVGTEDRVEADR